jgi:hypothetical protein
MSAEVFFCAVAEVVYVPDELLSVQVVVAVEPLFATTMTIKSPTAGVAVTVCVPEEVSNEEPRRVTVAIRKAAARRLQGHLFE